MFIESNFLVYPEGETQEIEFKLQFNQIVDLNGRPVSLPLANHKMIVYKVTKIQNKEMKGETTHYYHLELVRGDELFSLAAR
ncbi:MAG TPA: hypothetical protein VJ967_02370 [Clostridia bacterium]|nr:hypothetical protein [Clostridia bacterium]